uniref:Uncharacterized protein n=1 Tax=Aegilops tauschii subsp. strangulata TaxID=200361 RepID=A0A453S7H3_AEGTS
KRVGSSRPSHRRIEPAARFLSRPPDFAILLARRVPACVADRWAPRTTACPSRPLGVWGSTAAAPPQLRSRAPASRRWRRRPIRTSALGRRQPATIRVDLRYQFSSSTTHLAITKF